ncbi:MAG: hypothetical protein EPN72_10930 [Nevskiaceae bacterium]|nr:MAG: hypothetical protein EPN63_05940 [Nevskiaceae bacterium]TBR72278.1 MAG: hypothetical protein EPN72_10930 [Nevskiaceae bacterium]
MLRHVFSGNRALRRDFPRATLAAIETAIAAAEARHAGEIRFAIEPALTPRQIRAGVTARARALEVFSHLGVWDTEHNNGVLIYLLLADRAVEIVADRGVAGGRVQVGEWPAVARRMEQRFRAGDFRGGCVAGIEGVADVLARHPPGVRKAGNELPDAPVILR